MSKKEEQRVSTKDDDPVRKLCVRFKRDYKQMRDFKDAVTYLSLRNNGCPRKEAILFAAKNNCRVDTTKGIDGPKDYRTLQNNQLEENFDEQEIQMRKEYKEMINRMKDYVKNINSKYNFSHETGDKLIEVVRKIVKGMKNELENRQYFILDGIRFYDAAEAIMQKRVLSLEEKNNLIEKLNVFNNFENDQEIQQLQIIKVNDEDLNNNEENLHKNPFLLGMFNYNNNNGINSRGSTITDKQLRESEQGQSKDTNYAHQLKNLECATKLLEEFEKNDGEDLQSGPNGKFDRSFAKQKRKRKEEMKNNLNLVREENQAGLEGQFNKQQYFYRNEDAKNKSLQKEQREKEELQQIIFDIYKFDDHDGYFQYISQLNNPEIHTNQLKPNNSQSHNHELIDMDIIKQMKHRQDTYNLHFRNKISTATAPHRTKFRPIPNNNTSIIPKIFSTKTTLQNNNNNNNNISSNNKNNRFIINNNLLNGLNNPNNQGIKIKPKEALFIQSNYQSLSNLNTLKNERQNDMNQSAATTAVRLSPFHSQSQLNYHILSQFNTTNSLRKSSFPSLKVEQINNSRLERTQDIGDSSIGMRTSKKQSQKDKINYSKDRTVTWMVKSQSQSLINNNNNNSNNSYTQASIQKARNSYAIISNSSIESSPVNTLVKNNQFFKSKSSVQRSRADIIKQVNGRSFQDIQGVSDMGESQQQVENITFVNEQ